MSWNDERETSLKKLWLDGLSASQIAKQLGGVTRNAVIGKVHRLGLSGRAAPSAPSKHSYKASATPKLPRAAQAQPAKYASLPAGPKALSAPPTASKYGRAASGQPLRFSGKDQTSGAGTTLEYKTLVPLAKSGFQIVTMRDSRNEIFDTHIMGPDGLPMADLDGKPLRNPRKCVTVAEYTPPGETESHTMRCTRGISGIGEKFCSLHRQIFYQPSSSRRQSGDKMYVPKDARAIPYQPEPEALPELNF